MAGKEYAFMDYVKKLRGYVEDLLKNQKHNYASEEVRKDWAFGAIDFSRNIELIDEDTCNALLKEFDLT